MALQNITILYDIKPDNKFFKTYLQAAVKEFGGIIPWLKDFNLDDSSSCLLLKDEQIIGGIMYFKNCPEDSNIIKFKEKVIGPGGIYISCFVVAEEYRSKGYGTEFIKQVLDYLFKKDNKIWGILANKGLYDFYQNMGGKITPITNKLSLLVFNK